MLQSKNIACVTGNDLNHDVLNVPGAVTAHSRIAMFAPTDSPITDLVVRFSNWYMNGQTLGRGAYETDNPNYIAVRAAIEYPQGVYHQLFNRLGSGQLELLPGANAGFEPCGLVIPAGAQFWVRPRGGSEIGIWPVGRPINAALGEQAFVSSSWADDFTLGGNYTSNTTLPFRPTLVTATTANARASVIIFGDSTSDGMTEVTDTKNVSGPGPRALRDRGYARFTIGGDGAFSIIDTIGGKLNCSRRFSLMSGANITHAVVAFGNNDMAHGDLDAMKSSALSFWGLLQAKGIAVFPCTIPPLTTSSDGRWATPATQGVTSFEPLRTGFNAWVCTNPGGVAGHSDVASVLEDPDHPGLWATNGIANDISWDGCHYAANGSLLAATAFDFAAFT